MVIKNDNDNNNDNNIFYINRKYYRNDKNGKYYTTAGLFLTISLIEGFILIKVLKVLSNK